MSFRELRNLSEIMRSLGYPRPISVDNFRSPNFELVADALYWLSKKYDPFMNISEEIDTEDDRIEFLTSIASAMLAKARVKLNTKKLYAGDGHAVKELLKIAQILYKASRLNPNSIDEDEDLSTKALLNSKLKDTKQTRLLSTEITDKGAKIYDLLENEIEIKPVRDNAIRFLDTVSTNLESTAEHRYLEKNIRDILNNTRDSLESMKKQIQELDSDEKQLITKMEKKRADLERNEKRLRSLQTVRPAFMDEYERLEKELEVQYKVFCERYRNLDYLQHELTLYDNQEKEKIKENERSMKRMQKRLREEELRILRGEQDDNLDFSMDDSMPEKRDTANPTPNEDDTSSSEGSGSSEASDDDSDENSAASDSDEEVSIGESETSNLIDNDDGESISDENQSTEASSSASGGESLNTSNEDDHDF